MSEAKPKRDAQRPDPAAVRVARLAGQQWGVIGRGQLRHCGLSPRAITRWRASGKLHDRHPGVYSYGHESVPIEGELVAALIYAGDGAVLSHRTAAWWWGLIDDVPRRIEVSTLARARSLPQILVHHPRQVDATVHRRFPITAVPQTLADLAADAPLNEVRRALAQADYLRVLDVDAVESMLGRGKHGSAKLRNALARHQPRLAYTRSWTERLLIGLCEAHGVPIPEVNVKLGPWTPDFLWREEGLVVETDGYGNHHTPGQLDRDRRKELALRGYGLTVNRYSRWQVEVDGESVVADLLSTLARLRAVSNAAPSAANPPARWV